MHHKNHKHSTSNHNNPQHIKPEYPSKPAPQSGGKKSVLSRIRERFQEKPATAEEVRQLRLDAQREVYKTQKLSAKARRPSRFGSFGGSSGPSYRRGSSRAAPQTGSWLLSENSRIGDNFLSGGGSGPSLDFITGANQKPSRGRKQESGFGQGLSDLFT